MQRRGQMGRHRAPGVTGSLVIGLPLGRCGAGGGGLEEIGVLCEECCIGYSPVTRQLEYIYTDLSPNYMWLRKLVVVGG